ncbi:thiamine pyrophosphate-binding protein [Sporosarcina sp. Marseille-Q4063]|uniref:thiamine pyrophosphate-binding protein n=1 Tax=Sporosarcina sp. Marseille-Q4063 TaxID=2810514 RepID=UPI001BAFB72C|nr:thiamine pyrophosphate-binding protein [Sporosarcina sp. Marseille-Q4063]QUW21407.1 thiamine pyrophosphate-binding protein [Sporosarcina sp. Marseille-Q4063]
MKTASSILVENFKHWGVHHIFGIPGKAISPILFELLNQDLEFVLSKHEAAAGFEATGYALMNERIGVAVGTSGPGGTNLITAAGQAKASNIPLLIITGHPSMKDTGKPLGQDSSIFGTDLVAMFKSVTKFSAGVERGDMLQPFLQHALEIAVTGVKGPVHLSIPFDVLLEEIESFQIDLPVSHEMISPKTAEVIEKLNVANRPLLFLGKGVHSSKAYEEVQHLAEYWNIPVITTPGGKGTFPSNHKLSLGAFGLGGTPEATAYFEEQVDLLLVIGSRLSDMSTAGLSVDMHPDHVIHFDYDPTYIGKAIQVPTTPVLGDIKSNLTEMLKDIPETDSESFLSQPEKKLLQINQPGEPMSAVQVLRAMRNALPDDAIIFGDDGSHSFYGIKYFDIHKPGTFYFDDIFGAMGNGIGYSIGAQLAAPEKTIVCLVGDGCMFMHGTEISTAYNYDSPVLFIVLNNGRLDMVEKGMQKMIGTSIGGIYETPLDAAKFAESMGLEAYTCYNPNDLVDSIEEALHKIEETNKPILIEAIVDEHEIPPTMGRQ